MPIWRWRFSLEICSLPLQKWERWIGQSCFRRSLMVSSWLALVQLWDGMGRKRDRLLQQAETSEKPFFSEATDFFRAWQDANGKLPDHFPPVQPQRFRQTFRTSCAARPQETFDLTVQVD